MLNIFIAGLFWGTIGIFVKSLSSLGADGSLIVFLRMFWAFAVMFVVCAVRHGREIVITDKKTLLSCAVLGIFCNGLFNVFYTSSIKINGMGIACVLMYTAPVFTALESAVIFREKFGLLKISALAMNIIGCVLTVTGGNFSVDALNLTGILAGLGSGLCYGTAAVAGRIAGEKIDAMTVSMYSFFFALIFVVVTIRPDVSILFGRPDILGVGFLYGLIPTSLAYCVYYRGLKAMTDTAKVPVIASIEPVAAVVIGVLLFGESMSVGNFVGVAVVIASIAVTALL